MTTSIDSGNGETGNRGSGPLDGVPSPSRYDLLLVAIPLCFALSVLVSVLSSVELHVAVGIAALLGAVAVVDALFVNPPLGRSGRAR